MQKDVAGLMQFLTPTYSNFFLTTNVFFTSCSSSRFYSSFYSCPACFFWSPCSFRATSSPVLLLWCLLILLLLLFFLTLLPSLLLLLLLLLHLLLLFFLLFLMRPSLKGGLCMSAGDVCLSVSKFEIRDVWLIQPCSRDGQSIK